MTTATKATKNEIDWDAAADVADALGRRALRLVAERDTAAIIDWSLHMARECDTSKFMAPRAASYLELAVLVGHATPPPKEPPPDREERLDWIDKTLESLGQQLQNVSAAVAAIAAEPATNENEEAKVDG
jgi:hypothetical protein